MLDGAVGGADDEVWNWTAEDALCAAWCGTKWVACWRMKTRCTEIRGGKVESDDIGGRTMVGMTLSANGVMLCSSAKDEEEQLGEGRRRAARRRTKTNSSAEEEDE